MLVKGVTQTTHITCAKCGGDNTVSNGVPSDGTVKLVNCVAGIFNEYNSLMFTCQHCKEEYPLINLPV